MYRPCFHCGEDTNVCHYDSECSALCEYGWDRKRLQELEEKSQVTSLSVETLKRWVDIDRDKDAEERHWIWIKVLERTSRGTGSGYYRIASGVREKEKNWLFCDFPDISYVFGFGYSDYGKTWLAYRYNPTETE